MDEKDLTPWFGPDTRPVHDGPYLTRLYDETDWLIYRSYRDGAWGTMGCTPEHADAIRLTGSISATQSWCWRGLAHPPKGA